MSLTSEKPSQKQDIKKALRASAWLYRQLSQISDVDARLGDIRSRISQCYDTLVTLRALRDCEPAIPNVVREQVQTYCNVVVQIDKTLGALYHERCRSSVGRPWASALLSTNNDFIQSLFDRLEELHTDIHLHMSTQLFRHVDAIDRNMQATRHDQRAMSKDMRAVESRLSTISDDTGMLINDVDIIRGGLKRVMPSVRTVGVKFEPMAGDMGTLERNILTIGEDTRKVGYRMIGVEDATSRIQHDIVALKDDNRSIKATMTELLQRVPQASAPVARPQSALQENAVPEPNATPLKQASTQSQAGRFIAAHVANLPVGPNVQSQNLNLQRLRHPQAPQNLPPRRAGLLPMPQIGLGKPDPQVYHRPSTDAIFASSRRPTRQPVYVPASRSFQ